jgi:hypothetical protein
MRRRRLLSALAALPVLGAGCLSGLPTATGPRSAPEPEGTPGQQTGVVVSDVDVDEGEEGQLLVVATLRNRGDDPTEATVAVTLTLGDEETVGEKTVEVPGRSSVETTVEFGATFDEFTGDGSVSARIR